METTSTITRFSIIPAMLKELAEEAAITRKFLALVPEDKYDWAPHAKSMKMGNLATHIAELPAWIAMGLNSDYLDFAESSWEPTELRDGAQLMEIFEKSVQEGTDALISADEDRFTAPWTLKMGERIISEMTRFETLRMSYQQTVHHRAQLGVYLRLLDIPIPGTYGPSADETDF